MPAVPHKTLSSLNSPVKAEPLIKVARLSVGMRSTPSAQPEDAVMRPGWEAQASVAGLPAVTTHRKVRDVLAGDPEASERRWGQGVARSSQSCTEESLKAHLQEQWWSLMPMEKSQCRG